MTSHAPTRADTQKVLVILEVLRLLPAGKYATSGWRLDLRELGVDPPRYPPGTIFHDRRQLAIIPMVGIEDWLAENLLPPEAREEFLALVTLKCMED